MKKCIVYLRNEGFISFCKKIKSNILYRFGRSSTTMFYQCNDLGLEKVLTREGIDVLKLAYSELSDFEYMKFFQHLDGNMYVNNLDKEIVIAKYGEKIVGYAAVDYGGKRDIHGLGAFSLLDNEAWIGPVYVIREYRKKGVNSLLINTLKHRMKSRSINCCYTCINIDNPDSITSFKRNGFNELGFVTSTKCKIAISKNNLLMERFCE